MLLSSGARKSLRGWFMAKRHSLDLELTFRSHLHVNAEFLSEKLLILRLTKLHWACEFNDPNKQKTTYVYYTRQTKLLIGIDFSVSSLD